MILYQFPPCNDVGAFRPVKFIKYLKQHNWFPIVLAPSNAIYASYDWQIEKTIKNSCRIYRAPLLNPIDFLSKINDNSITNYVQFVSRALNRILIPDIGILWFFSAIYRGLKIVRDEGIDAIFVSGQPFSTFIVATLIKKLTGVSMILDYRDPWILNPFYRGTKFELLIEKKLEEICLNLTDAAIFTSDEAREQQVKKFSKFINSGKAFTITNSFEPVLNRIPVKRTSYFKIIHAGNLYGNRNPSFFFRGLAKAIDLEPNIKSKVKVEFYGMSSPQKYKSILVELDINELIQFKNRVPSANMHELLQSADFLLIVNSFGEGHNVFIPAKFFDYLRVNKPILCMAKDGALKNIMQLSKAGLVVDPEDDEAICYAILYLYRDKIENEHRKKRTEINFERSAFESKNTTKNLSHILDKFT